MINFFSTLNFTGILVGLATFLIIMISRYSVIICEYYFSKKFWVAFLIFGILMIGISLLTKNLIISSILSILGYSYLWGIGEIIQQEERVKKGWFPANPGRRYDK